MYLGNIMSILVNVGTFVSVLNKELCRHCRSGQLDQEDHAVLPTNFEQKAFFVFWVVVLAKTAFGFKLKRQNRRHVCWLGSVMLMLDKGSSSDDRTRRMGRVFIYFRKLIDVTRHVLCGRYTNMEVIGNHNFIYFIKMVASKVFFISYLINYH